jgi:hypothetical protein
LICDPYLAGWVTDQTSTLTNPLDFYCKLLVWTGDYDTYADAYAAGARGAPGVYAGETPVFVNGTAAAEVPPPDLTDMPALIMVRGLMGDANLDGRVDIDDLTVVLARYNQTGMTWGQGDFNGDGQVDINDLTIVLAHYNQTTGAAGIVAVPEPSAIGLLLASAACLLGFARRRRT